MKSGVHCSLACIVPPDQQNLRTMLCVATAATACQPPFCHDILAGGGAALTWDRVLSVHKPGCRAAQVAVHPGDHVNRDISDWLVAAGQVAG